MHAKLLLAVAALAAGGLTACGGGDDTDDTRAAGATVGDILRVTPEYTRTNVRVKGTATPVKELGFVLADGGESIFVDVPPKLLRTVHAGERVTVTGVVQRLPSSEASRLSTPRDVVRGPGDRPRRASRRALRALAHTPQGAGAPYIDAESVDRVDLKPRDDPSERG